jgi:hypothetical protein
MCICPCLDLDPYYRPYVSSTMFCRTVTEWDPLLISSFINKRPSRSLGSFKTKHNLNHGCCKLQVAMQCSMGGSGKNALSFIVPLGLANFWFWTWTILQLQTASSPERARTIDHRPYNVSVAGDEINLSISINSQIAWYVQHTYHIMGYAYVRASSMQGTFSRAFTSAYRSPFPFEAWFVVWLIGRQNRVSFP